MEAGPSRPAPPDLPPPVVEDGASSTNSQHAPARGHNPVEPSPTRCTPQLLNALILSWTIERNNGPTWSQGPRLPVILVMTGHIIRSAVMMPKRQFHFSSLDLPLLPGLGHDQMKTSMGILCLYQRNHCLLHDAAGFRRNRPFV